MVALQFDFTEGTVLFAEVVPSPPKVDHLQGAMFLDRPDLWPIKPRRVSLRAKRGNLLPKEQQLLFNPE